ncbi:CRISPR-associated endoribonuclease Cas6 [Bacillus alveayuensis]|jgi:CRISPR-associated endoribonuclease Cas6|uniref:CRISPR-associated endoribonuclease Cas6 n=1 Tax=Aeribacillus alveayuensis TaxID=279215 RepID=UPI0005D0F9D8|nr:CRISPR-associated endoribonuclease Cas6 [Bacillus alveayuensis]
MRVELRFEIKELPIGYRLGVLSIIKEMVRNGSDQYYKELFEKGNSQLKPFGYSTYIHNLSINKNKILGDVLVLTISSSFYEFMMHLMNGSYKKKEYQYKGFTFFLKSKRLIPEYNIQQRIVTFSTKSPLLLETKEKKPVLSTDANFEKELQYISTLIIEELYKRKPYQPIRVLKTAMKKQVLKESLHHRKEKPIYLTANKGLITLEGHPKDLQAIYDNGVGFRRSLGLGLLDVEEVTLSEWTK